MSRRLGREAGRAAEITPSDIRGAKAVLFSVFSRYGDSFISFKVINEFITRYPEKSYILLTTNQALPYARRIINNKDVEIHGINKRKNPVRLLGIARLLKRLSPDLGFNPWSLGTDSEYFITFAKKFLPYRSFSAYPKEYNLYDRIREYLLLGQKKIGTRLPELEGVRNIVVAPFSTDVTKSLNGDDLKVLLGQIKKRFPGSALTIALGSEDLKKVPVNEDKFIFGKDLKSSERFAELLAAADLFIGVDAGPLHLADALGIRTIGIFGPTAPETILDRTTAVLPVRDGALSGTFCFVRDCIDPVCIHRLFESDFLSFEAGVNFSGKTVLEERKCKVKLGTSMGLEGESQKGGVGG